MQHFILKYHRLKLFQWCQLPLTTVFQTDYFGLNVSKCMHHPFVSLNICSSTIATSGIRFLSLKGTQHIKKQAEKGEDGMRWNCIFIFVKWEGENILLKKA